MTLILNLLWMIFGGGLVIFFEYLVAGVVLCLTIIGIPFGTQCFKIAGLGLFPFGKDIQEARRGMAGSTVGFAFNVIWFLFAGLWIFLSHLALGLGLAVTIIGIPFALQHLKLAALAIAPFGQQVR